nr:TIGR02270 family protein [Myxococcus sp. RHSTA-1-4]
MAPSPSPPESSAPPVILWDVVEEHFQEADFLWTQRERSLRAPDQSLADVAEGDEYRLVAHLEGLLHAGPRAAERLLLPALREGLPGEVAVAALCLLASEDRDWSGAVLSTLPETEQPAALLAGLALCPGAVEPALRECFPALETPFQAQVLDVLAFRRADPGALLESTRTRDEPAVVAAALRAARFTHPDTTLALVGRGLAHGHPLVRDAALVTGCIFGHREAWLRCRRIVEQTEPFPRQALMALAMGGEARDLSMLQELLSRSDLRDEALWALGFAGRLAAIESLLTWLRAGEPAAAAPLALVSGLSVEKLMVPSGQQEDAPAEDEPESGAALPGPVMMKGTVLLQAIETWWKVAGARLPTGGRYLCGRPWSLESLLTALEEAPGPWRPGLAWELAVRTRGSIQVEPRAWSWEQRGVLGTAARHAPRFQAGPFARFMSA